MYRKPRLTSPDIASCSESILFTGQVNGGAPTGLFATGLKNTTFPAYRNTDISLSTFTRARQIAENYQFFKIKYFELSIIPDFDTFVVGGAGAQGKPFVYYMIDRGNTINANCTNQDLKSMGAKPVVLDEKQIKIRWRPAVVLANEIQTSTGTTSAQQYMISPWLNTDATGNTGGFQPSQVCHYGIKWAAENIGGSMSYTATLTAHFSFKKPLYQNSQTSDPANP